MSTRLDGRPRCDLGTTRKYASVEERDAIRRAQRRAANRRWRERNKEQVRQRSATYRQENREICIERTKKWQRENPERVKETMMQRKYGIGLSQFNQLLDYQGGSCAVCGSIERLVVDHCHATEAIRGILCDRCNVGIGCLSDDAHRLIAAADYLSEGGHTCYAQLVVNRLSGSGVK
jgi:hypothetical protein